MTRVHIVVVGCGRVGSELAMQLSEEGHSVVVDRQESRRLRRLTHFHGKTIVGSGFDRDVLFQADATTRRRAGGGDQWRQHEHPLRAHRARQLRHQERGRAHLRPGARRHLHEARHPHGGDVAVDDPAGEALDVARATTPSSGPTPARHHAPRRAHRARRPRRQARQPASTSATACASSGIIRGGQGRVNVEGLFAQEDDILEFLVTDDGPRRAARACSRRGCVRVVDRRRRFGRHVDRARPRGPPPRRDLDGAGRGDRRASLRDHAARGQRHGGRRLRVREPRRGRRAQRRRR